MNWGGLKTLVGISGCRTRNMTRMRYVRQIQLAAIGGFTLSVVGLSLPEFNWFWKGFFYFHIGLFSIVFIASLTFRRLTATQNKKAIFSSCPGNHLLIFSEFVFSKLYCEKVAIPAVTDMREEYFEALAQNSIWKARWVRVRGTYSFFAAIGLDRAFAFVSFFIKAWKSVN